MNKNNFKPITPLLAADTIIEIVNDKQQMGIVLIERKNPPYGWAIPGGFVDVGETVEAAAIREAKEEVCLDVRLKCLLGIYSDPARDSRGHTVTAVYVATADAEPIAADDAKTVAIFNINSLPTDLAFDHDKVLQDYIQYKKFGVVKSI